MVGCCLIRAVDLADGVDANGLAGGAAAGAGAGVNPPDSADSGATGIGSGGRTADEILATGSSFAASFRTAPRIPRSIRIESEIRIVAAIPMGNAQRGALNIGTGGEIGRAHV